MDQVETMARAMCVADGHDADEAVEVAEGRVPRWRLYEPQARKLVAAQQALLAGS